MVWRIFASALAGFWAALAVNAALHLTIGYLMLDGTMVGVFAGLASCARVDQ